MLFHRLSLLLLIGMPALSATTTEDPDRQPTPGLDVTTRWRPAFAELQSADPELRARLVGIASPVHDEKMDTETTEALRPLDGLLAAFSPPPGDRLNLPPIHGPETPFPDHAPLAEIARLRLALLKLAWTDGQHARAIRLARDNLDFARAFLLGQEGIIPVITASGVWQTALDGVYWLARQPGLDADAAAMLQARLAEDHDLAARALSRAFEGEFTFVQKVVIERLPATNDPELILDSIGSLGMAPPAAPPEGEPRLPVTERRPFDPNATLAGVKAEVAAYLAAFASEPARHPHGIATDVILPARRRLAAELGALLRYATTDEAVTPAFVAETAEVLARVENPLGKLYLLIAPPHWNPVSETVHRRQAQNNALQILLAWRRHGRPADARALIDAGLLDAAPPDPFSDGALRIDARRSCVWSVGPDRADDNGEGDGENLGRPADLAWPWSPAEP